LLLNQEREHQEGTETKADEAATGLGYGPSMYPEEILEMEEGPMGDEEMDPTKNATENNVNGPRMDVEAVSTTVDVNLKKPKIPCSQQKCSDCPLYGHKTMRSILCKEHHRYLQLRP